MRAGAGRRRARADGRLDRQHQGRARHRREGGARSDRDVRHARGAAGARRPRSRTSAIARGCSNHAEDARQSRELARIRTDVPVEFDPDALRYRGASRERCFELFTRLGFRTLVMEYAPTAETVGKDYARRRHARSDCARWPASCGGAGRFALPRAARRPVGDARRHRRPGVLDRTAARRATCRSPPASSTGGLFGEPGDDAAGPADRRRRSRLLKPLLEDAALAQDRPRPEVRRDRAGAPRHHAARPRDRHDDRQLSARLRRARRIRSRSSRSSTPATRRCARRTSAAAAQGDVVRAAAARRGARLRRRARRPRAAAVRHAARPAREGIAGRRLRRRSSMPLIPVLVAIERAGVRVDVGALSAQSSLVERELDRLAARVYELAGEEFNINSPKKLSEVLFDKLGFEPRRSGARPRRRRSRRRSKCSRSWRCQHELPQLMLEWRGLQKLKGTYIDALPQLVHPETGRVHTCFNQAVAATGRLSSSDPNLQNIPIRTELGREIRRAFVAEPGNVLISADYSQIELRVLAHLSGEQVAGRRVRARRGHPRPDGGEGLRRRERPERARAPAPRQDRQLRAALREAGVHAGQGHRRLTPGGAGVHRRLLRRLPGRPRLHRPHARGGARERGRQDDVRPAPAGAGLDQPQRPDSRPRPSATRSTCRSRAPPPTS